VGFAHQQAGPKHYLLAAANGVLLQLVAFISRFVMGMALHKVKRQIILKFKGSPLLFCTIG